MVVFIEPPSRRKAISGVGTQEFGIQAFGNGGRRIQASEITGGGFSASEVHGRPRIRVVGDSWQLESGVGHGRARSVHHFTLRSVGRQRVRPMIFPFVNA